MQSERLNHLRSLFFGRPHRLFMRSSLLRLAIVATVASTLLSGTALAQLLRNSEKVAGVVILEGPALELARADFAVIRWTTYNPGGADEHFGVVHYGTDPTHLSLMAKSHIRLNRGHPETIFRVRLNGLEPLTTYYYTVASIDGSEKNDMATSPVSQFITPRRGERVVAYPPQSVTTHR